MGLFDQLVGGIEAEAGQKAALYEEVAKLVTEAGGVNGLLQQFQQKGLEGVMAGWISNGSNPPITADQIVQVVGQDKVTEIASKVGLSEQQVVDGISKILPVIVNHLTPNGTVAAPPSAAAATPAAAPAQPAGDLEGALLGDLKSKLFGS